MTSANFFGGDEVGAMVLDMGATTTRFGFAGEDCPKLIFPSSVGACSKFPEPPPTPAAKSSKSKSAAAAAKMLTYNPPDKFGYTAEQLGLPKKDMRIVGAMQDNGAPRQADRGGGSLQPRPLVPPAPFAHPVPRLRPA